MADPDPEKILAEFEAVRRLHLAEAGRNGLMEGRKMLLVGIVVILLGATVALWALSIVLDQLPKPPGHRPAPVSGQTAR